MIEELKATLHLRYKNIHQGLLRRLTMEIMLEVQEARLYLDRDEPNVPAAMRRLDDIERILREANGAFDKFVENYNAY